MRVQFPRVRRREHWVRVGFKTNEFGWTGDLGVPACLGVAPLNAASPPFNFARLLLQVTRAREKLHR